MFIASTENVRMFQKSWIKNTFTILIAAVAFSEVALAESPTTPTLSQEIVLTKALSASPLVKEINATLANRLALAIDTGLKANPQLYAVLGFPSEPAGQANKTQINASLSQQLRPSDFGTRDAVAQIMSSSADVEKKLSILGLSQEVSLSYAKLWILQEQTALLTEQQKRANNMSTLVNTAIDRGALGRGEGGLFGAEVKKLNATSLGLNADKSREQANLLQLSTVSTKGLHLAPPPKSLAVSVQEILTQLNQGTLPIQSRFRLLKDVSQKRADLARLDAFPSFAPQLTYQRTEDGGYFMGGGFQVDLPFFNRNQAEITRSQGELAAANARSRYSLSDSFRDEVFFRIESLQAIENQALAYERDVIPALTATLNQFNAQLSAGTGTALMSWQAQRELQNAQQERLAFWQNYFTARSELSLLIGQQL